MVKKFRLLDNVWGRYTTILFEKGVNFSSLPERTVIKVKAPNQYGKPDEITDIPAGALRYIPPKHPKMPQEGVFVLLAGPGGVNVIGEEIGLIKGEVFEKIAEAEARSGAAIAAKEIESKLALRSTSEQVKEAMETTKEVQEASKQFFPFYDQQRRNEQLINKGG